MLILSQACIVALLPKRYFVPLYANAPLPPVLFVAVVLAVTVAWHGMSMGPKMRLVSGGNSSLLKEHTCKAEGTQHFEHKRAAEHMQRLTEAQCCA